MKGFLNTNQIEYVLSHLSQSIDLSEEIKENFVFVKSIEESFLYKNKIIFVLHETAFDISDLLYINDLPVLYANSKINEFYKIENDNIVFYHDLLKSSFYLLSGFQEYNSNEKDNFGRYKFENSIQKNLNITHKPIVNYYFEEIIKGIEKYCLLNNLNFSRKKIFDNFGFLLTHDVDRVDAYNFDNVSYVLMQFLGLKKPIFNKVKTLKVFFKSFFNYLNFIKRKNPFWNFEFLRNVEKRNGFVSDFYFLKNEGKLDSKYSFQEKRIKNLMKYLINEQCEVGVHGTMSSATSLESMLSAVNEIESITNKKAIGCRQHFLQYHLPKTTIIHQESGIKYDTSLGFAEHEGFRNSYCLPFKLYNFDDNKMFDVWEFPLNLMDVTLLGYRNTNFIESKEIILDIIKEIKKFNGLFTWLWHNCRFDEEQYKGITNFYIEVLNMIKSENPDNYNGRSIVEKLNRK